MGSGRVIAALEAAVIVLMALCWPPTQQASAMQEAPAPVIVYMLVVMEEKPAPVAALPADPAPPEPVSLGTFKLYAYCPCAKCCRKSDGITKTGTVAAPGRTIAVDPAVIPLGSRVVIDGLGEYIAEDTGSGIRGNVIDMYMEDHQTALDFGIQYAEVWITPEPDAP